MRELFPQALKNSDTVLSCPHLLLYAGGQPAAKITATLLFFVKLILCLVAKNADDVETNRAAIITLRKNNALKLHFAKR